MVITVKFAVLTPIKLTSCDDIKLNNNAVVLASLMSSMYIVQWNSSK